MANEPKILTRRGLSSEGHWSTALEPAQCVDAGQIFVICDVFLYILSACLKESLKRGH